MIQALLSVDTVVFIMIPVVVTKILAFSDTNTIVFTMMQVLLSVDAVDSHCLYSGSGILEDPRRSCVPRWPGNIQTSGIRRLPKC